MAADEDEMGPDDDAIEIILRSETLLFIARAPVKTSRRELEDINVVGKVDIIVVLLLCLWSFDF